MPQESFETMDSDQLMAILKEHDTSSYSEEDFEHIEQKLADRGFYVSDKKLVEKKELTGINGWLVLPAIGLVFAPFMALYYIIMDVEMMAEHPRYESLFGAEIAINVIVIIAAIISAVFFFMKHRAAPTIIITFLAINVILMFIDAAMAVEAFGSRIEDEAYMDAARALIAAAIWIPYFLVSKRVKNTFIK